MVVPRVAGSMAEQDNLGICQIQRQHILDVFDELYWTRATSVRTLASYPRMDYIWSHSKRKQSHHSIEVLQVATTVPIDEFELIA